MDSPSRLIATIARSQHGVFTRSQALAAGVGDRTIDSRAAKGVYERVHPEVFGFPGATETWHRSVVAATLSVASLAAASHRTAAYLWGMTSTRPEMIEIVCRRHRRVHRGTFVVHESKDLLESDIAILDGLTLTSAARTVVDLGAVASLGIVARCLDTGLRTELFTLEQVERLARRVARPGRAGVGTIKPLVEERIAWSGVTESALEDVFRAVVTRTGLPMPEPQLALHDQNGDFVGRFDFAYPTQRALIELDSERWHMDPGSFQRDRQKQNGAHALGWTVYRFTWRQLMQEPASVIRTLAYITAK